MKNFISKTMMLLAVAATLVSFTNLGGEGFEITLNNKVVVQQYGPKFNTAERLVINSYSANDQLTVKYHHCGKVAKDRVITIKDEKNKIVKEWRFADAATPLSPMNCSVKEIINLGSKKDKEFKLFYASTELPAGRLLTTIVVETQSIAQAGE